jgi:hypothetical protein
MNTQVDDSQELRHAFERRVEDLRQHHHGFMRHTEQTAEKENAQRGTLPMVTAGDYCSLFIDDAWKIYQAFHASLVANPEPPKHVTRYDGGVMLGGQSVVKSSDFDAERSLRLSAEKELAELRSAYQLLHEERSDIRRERDGAIRERDNLQADLGDLKRHSNLLEIGVKNFGRLIELQKSQASMAKRALDASGGALRNCIDSGSMNAGQVSRLELILATCVEACALITATADLASERTAG